MKTILVPTDFSDASTNSLDYAVEIAKLTNAKLILFHVYHIPIITSEVPLVIPTLEEMENECTMALQALARNISLKNGNSLLIEYVCKCGFAVDEINQFAQEEEIDLIVMGMQGAGYITQKLIGSVTTSLIRNTKRPILVIDKHIKFKSIKKIVLACDYHEIKNNSVVEPLKKLAHLFKAHTYILNVVPELETTPTTKEAIAGIQLEHFLENMNHSFHSIKNEDVVNGITGFITSENMDMLAMIPHKHSVIKTIFHPSNTKHMAFHTTVPLLILNEQA